MTQFKRNTRYKYDLYCKAYYKTLEDLIIAYDQMQVKKCKDIVKKLVVYGVKAVNTKPKQQSNMISKKEAKKDFEFADIIVSLMATLTPKEFISLYPIIKDYDGHRYGMKDYFYTIKYIKTLNADDPIGDEEIFNFLWEYHNMETRMFNVKFMGCIDNLRMFNGKPSMVEEWANENGLKTYRKYEKQDGTEFLLDSETGKTIRVKKPRRLKIVR